MTYPPLKLAEGTSPTFPADCASNARVDWKWRASTSSWFPGFRGTPNAPNDDARCP